MARREFRKPKKEEERVKSLEKSFNQLVKKQSILKQKSRDKTTSQTAKKALHYCHNQFWRFTSALLDKAKANIQPSFSEQDAYEF